MKNKTILLIVGLAFVLLLALATIFYQDLSQQYSTDTLPPRRMLSSLRQDKMLNLRKKSPLPHPISRYLMGMAMRSNFPIL